MFVIVEALWYVRTDLIANLEKLDFSNLEKKKLIQKLKIQPITENCKIFKSFQITIYYYMHVFAYINYTDLHI